MNPAAPHTGPSDDGQPRTQPTPPSASLLQEFEALWGELRGLLHDHLNLAGLEARRAAGSLVVMVACGVVVGVLLCGAWFGVLAVTALWLVDSGLGAAAALLLVVMSNLVGALALLVVIRHRSAHLRFPASLGSLAPAQSDAGAARAGA